MVRASALILAALLAGCGQPEQSTPDPKAVATMRLELNDLRGRVAELENVNKREAALTLRALKSQASSTNEDPSRREKLAEIQTQEQIDSLQRRIKELEAQSR